MSEKSWSSTIEFGCKRTPEKSAENKTLNSSSISKSWQTCHRVSNAMNRVTIASNSQRTEAFSLMKNLDATQSANADKFEPTASDLQDLVTIVNGREPFGSGITAADTTITEDQIEKVAQHIRRDGARAEQIVGSLVRKYKLQFLSRAVCWMAEASTVEGYLEKLMSEGGVAIATNTTDEQALNAAVVRFLTSRVTDAEMDKTEVSRAATALAGLQILCKDNGVAPSFGTFADVLALATGSSCDGLMKVAKQRRKLDEPVPTSMRGDAAQSKASETVHSSGNAADPTTSSAPIETPHALGGSVADRREASASVTAGDSCSEAVRQPILIVNIPEGLSGDQFTFEGHVINGQLHLFLAVSSTDR
jgi:hypothetical protein